MVNQRNLVLFFCVLLIGACQSTSRNETDEFRIVADQGLLFAPDVETVSFVRVTNETSRFGNILGSHSVDFYVSRSEHLEASLSSGVWQAQAPTDLKTLDRACYVATDGENLLPMRAGSSSDPSSYIVSFSAAYPLVAARNAETKLAAQKRLIEQTIASTNQNVSVARRALERDPLYRNDVCTEPSVSLPERPRNAVSPARAHELAERDVGICMRERIGCDIGADEFVRQTGLPRITGIPAGYVCGQYLQSGRCPADELTGLVDALQGMFFSGARDENLLSAAAYLVTIVARYNEDVAVVSRAYSRPYYSWQSRVRQANNAAHNRYLTCQNHVDTIERAPAIIRTQRANENRLNRYLAVAESIANDNENVIWRADATACNALTCRELGRRTICGVIPN